ncbi:mitochondrial 54S ribosomal protein RML2 [Aulographum hederae CBS 113979]|uniref:Large ribosomal subunit protein uL2m n=1 Tax=Aulographum hederae CBS 113979 TaxID=1176131 RepID=A0A6G1H8L9_9PEZI|nr:mitochondrial 54S ribosomal protein RML2 [Aulographum hederae CBS 113979]
MLQPRLLQRYSAATRYGQCLFSSFRRYASTNASQTKTSSTDVFGSFNAMTVVPDTKTVAPPVPLAKRGHGLVRSYKPRTPGTRHLRRPINDHLWKGRPERSLTFAKKGHGLGGRNNTGRITVRHRGGGHKRRIRMVDFIRYEGGRHTVQRIEHDPGRTAHIALLEQEETGKKSYIVAADGMRAGDVVQSYRKSIPKDLLEAMGGSIDPGILAAKTAFRGNCLPVNLIPVGTQVYNIGSMAGHTKGAVFCRSAGTHGTIVSKGVEGTAKHVIVRLQSGEVRKVDAKACATIGIASNPNFHFGQLGKAGRKRWLGIRPTVRGVAMNSVDHPHGGGRGKSKGNKHPVSPWGQLAKGGFKTRKKRNPNKFVVKERERNQGKRRVQK